MKFSFTKNPESDFSYKESKPNKKNLAGGRGGGVARVSDFFSKEFKYEKKSIVFLRGVKVREDWLV